MNIMTYRIPPSHRHSRQGGVTLATFCACVGIFFVLGLCGSLEVTSSRRVLDSTYHDRLAESLSRSAFEEASSTLERSFARIPFPDSRQVQGSRDLSQLLPWPHEASVLTTRAMASAESVQVTAVSLVVSPWRLERFEVDQERRCATIREVGLVLMSVGLTWRDGRRTATRRISTRRYMTAVGSPGASHAHLEVMPADAVFSVSP